MPNKEQIYDAEIEPLMAQILDICKTHRIAMIASFALPIPGDKGLRCTSALLEDSHVEEVERVTDYVAAKEMLLNGFVAVTRSLK